MSWLNDADGDVFRSLAGNNFNFDEKHIIDVNIDFNHWPLQDSELELIGSLFRKFEVIEPESDEEDIGNGKGIGFIQIQTESILSYDFIVSLQKEITVKTESIGGFCNSWEVES
jgi:hypothetical protein